VRRGELGATLPFFARLGPRRGMTLRAREEEILVKKAEKEAGIGSHIQVLRNRIPSSWWGTKKRKNSFLYLGFFGIQLVETRHEIEEEASPQGHRSAIQTQGRGLRLLHLKKGKGFSTGGKEEKNATS